MGLNSGGLAHPEPRAALPIFRVRPPSQPSLISRNFLKGATATADVRRRIKRSKTNHLHRERRRCFNLAIVIHSSCETLTDTQAEIINVSSLAQSTRCRAALRMLLHVYGHAADVQPICCAAVPERVAH